MITQKNTFEWNQQKQLNNRLASISKTQSTPKLGLSEELKISRLFQRQVAAINQQEKKEVIASIRAGKRRSASVGGSLAEAIHLSPVFQKIHPSAANNLTDSP